jgi:hypothetical protein
MKHIEPIAIYPKNVVKIYNLWFSFLMKQGFTLVPKLTQVEVEDYVKVSSFSFQQGKALQKVETLDDVLSFINTLKSQLTILDATVSVTWNYIGSENSRMNYMNELETFFWTYQDQLSQLLPLQSKELLDQPWKIARFAGNLDFPTPTASQFFDSKAGDFMQSLITKFSNYELDPYLVHSKLGSFHWKIVTKDIEFTGFMEKKETYFLHNINYTSL